VLRLKVPNTGAMLELSSKFGAGPGEAVDLILEADRRGLVVEGISFHVGSQTTNFQNYVEALNLTADIYAEANSRGYTKMNLVDIGGGFPAPYDSSVRPFRELAKIINSEINRLFPKHIEILAEPGRYFVATAGYALACTDCHPSGAYTVSHKSGSVNFVTDFGATRNAAFTGGTYDINGDATWTAWVGAPAENGHAYFCGNMACHSTGEPRGAETIVYKNTTQWTVVASGACGTCHTITGSALSTNVHDKHVGLAASSEYGYACQTCHSTVVDATPAIISNALHVNGTNNVAFLAAETGASYAGTVGGTVAPAGGVCTATYCHSQGLDWSAPSRPIATRNRGARYSATA
jgi:predicted CxxxxCH...CXXCH cytochrome family protein